jgi:acetyl esterase/lipase
MVKWIAGIGIALVILGYATLELSPWPSALFYRVLMNRGGDGLQQALERHVPAGVAALADLRYDATDADALLDVYHLAQGAQALPTIVWVHGGGFLSGSKGQIGNYLKILAAKGYTTVSVGYSLGPGSHYPTPVRQVNAALGYLVKNAPRLRIDPDRLFLAGDSAGAQIAAQVANVVSSPSYAAAVGVPPSIKRSQLRGVILHCGVYDLALADFDGPFGRFMRTAIWSYGGRRNVRDDAHMAEFSVLRFVGADFPPAFISAGNADPLLPHSLSLAETLNAKGARVETLFFRDDYQPALPHEYQFNLDTEAGRLALERSLKFLSSL